MKLQFGKLGVFETVKNADGTWNILHVDIFKLGEAKGFDYTEEWAQFALGVFNKEKNSNGYLPTIIIGHNDWLETEEKPAMGFMDNLVLEGEIIYADFIKLQQDTFDKLQHGDYPYRSIEVTPAEFRITAIALLGGTEPYFKLTPLANFSKTHGRKKAKWIMFGDLEEEETDLFSVEEIQKVDPLLAKALREAGYSEYRLPLSIFKTEENNEMKTKEELEKEAKELEVKAQQFATEKAALDAREKEVKEKEEKFKKLEEENAKAKLESFRKDVDSFLQSKLENGKLTPAMKDSFQAILYTHGTSVTKFKDEEKSVFEIVKQLLEAIPQSVSFKIESTGKDQPLQSEKEKTMHEFETKFEEFRKANPNMKYGDALRKFTAENKELANKYQSFKSSNAEKVAA